MPVRNSSIPLVCLLAGVLQAADWSQWRGPERTARSPETGLFGTWDADGPPLAWAGQGAGNGYASVAVVADRAYTTGNTESGQAVVAFDTLNGRLVWSRAVTPNNPDHGYEGSRCTPTVDGDRLYVVTSDGAIVCLAAREGQILWRRDFSDWGGRMMSGWGFSESPLVDGAHVICTPGGPQGMVVALDKTSGEEIWASQMSAYSDEEGINGKPLKDGAGYASAVISHGGGVKQYVQLVGRGLIGVRASDGRLLWRYRRVANGTANIPTPLVQDDYLFTSTGYGTGAALLRLRPAGDGVKAEEVYWLDSRTMQNKHGGMVLVDGYVYAGHGNGQGLPICIEMMTGQVAWGPERAAGSGETSVVYADGHIVYRREDGTVILARATPEEFAVVHTFKPEFQEGKSWAHPVIAGGRLYLREQDRLMCYELK